MYATVRTYTAGHELADGLVANQGAVKELITDIDGFKAYYLIRTAEGVVSVSVYQDKAGAEASNQAASTWVRENLDVQGSTPQVSAGEVVIDA